MKKMVVCLSVLFFIGCTAILRNEGEAGIKGSVTTEYRFGFYHWAKKTGGESYSQLETQRFIDYVIQLKEQPGITEARKAELEAAQVDAEKHLENIKELGEEKATKIAKEAETNVN